MIKYFIRGLACLSPFLFLFFPLICGFKNKDIIICIKKNNLHFIKVNLMILRLKKTKNLDSYI